MLDRDREMETLRKEIKRLRDIEEIGRLKHRYCQFADGIDGTTHAKELALLFTEQGKWSVNGKVTVGRRAIENEATSAIRPWRIAFHCVMSPLIDVNEDRATGRWYGLFPLIPMGSSDIVWLGGVYDERYLRTDEGWLFESVKIDLALNANALDRQSAQQN